ncbi:MAG: hypothetical protein PHF05_07435 [Candidatus Izemoplasmatales bacterium]|nr:hypothetical protein [Candidatus Izemoplasmatales bacterium]
MALKHWKKLSNQILIGKINRRNFIDFPHYDEIIHDVAIRIKKYGYYTFDGRFEDCIIDFLCKMYSKEVENYDLEETSKTISTLMKKDIVPNIIVIPLNHLNRIYLPEELVLDNDIAIFAMNEKLSKIKNDKSLIARYVEKKIFCHFNADHILITKDPYFFNYPIIAIKIEHIDYIVEHEAPKIVEAVYSLIRMLDFKQAREPGDHGWGVRRRDRIPEAFTYVVYYKETGSDYENLKEGELGYSFRFKFSPILDINTKYLVDHIEQYSSLLKKVIDNSFIVENDFKKNEYTIRKKWINAIAIFNTAYEFLSIGKIDSAVLLLFTILESLFFKLGEYNKKDMLIERIEAFFAGIDWSPKIKPLMKNVSKYRNEFVHQGIGLERFKTYRSLNDREGHLQGQKPFVHDAWYPMPEKEFRDINVLIGLVITIIVDNPERLFSFYIDNIETD